MDPIIHPVLSNPLILNTILSYLPTNEVKQCRLVCRDWEDVSTPLLGKIAFISINKFTQSLGESRERYPLVKPHPLLADQLLFKRLKYVGDAPLILSRVNPEFLSFMGKCEQEIVEEVRLDLTRDYYETVAESFIFNHFGNLKQISIHHIHLDFDCNDFLSVFRWEAKDLSFRIPELPTVQTLVFTVSEYKHPFQPRVVTCNPLYQCLVSCSPNLERLVIQGNFYPSLHTCAKLKYLSWKGIPFDMLEAGLLDNSSDSDQDEETDDDEYIEDLKPRPEFSVPRLLGMLMRVQDVLEQLELGTTLKYSGNRQGLKDVWIGELNDEQVPSFPNLVKLSMDKVSVFKKILNEINPEHFPVLKTLIITSVLEDEDAEPLDDFFFKKTDNCFPAIESAIIDRIPIRSNADNSIINYSLQEKFPNMSQLSLGIWTFDSDPVDTIRLQLFLKGLTRLTNLQHLTILIKGECTTSRLFEYFGDNGFVGLKTLTFVDEASTRVVDTNLSSIPYYFKRPDPPMYEKLLLAFRNVTFQGFSLKKITMQKMVKFAHERNLQINFFPYALKSTIDL